MNKHIIRMLVALFVGTSALFSSCDKEPVAPVNPIDEKLHEDPAKIVYTLIEGTLPEGTTLEEALPLSALTPTGQPQVYIETVGAGGQWSRAEGSVEHFQVKSTEEDPNLAYALKIEYFNTKGEPMNNQFFDNNQDKIHQHFFTYYNQEQKLVRELDQLPYRYAYSDTNPFGAQDSPANLVGKTNPMGFKGIIRFVQAGAEFNLGVELLHAMQSKYTEGTTTSPYYAPSNAQRMRDQWDIRRQVPIKVNAHEHEEEEESEVSKIVLKMVEGHLHGDTSPNRPRGSAYYSKYYHKLHQNARPAGMKFYHSVQTITLVNYGGKWEPARGSAKQFNLISDLVNDMGVYGLWVEYYDADGELMHDEIYNARDEHQTFFTATNVRSTEWSKVELGSTKTQDVFEYFYADSDPWSTTIHDGAKLIGDKEPIGFKGAIWLKKKHVSFDLNIRLGHLGKNKKKSDGSLRKYYEVPLSAHIDAAVSVPVVVMLDNSELENYDIDLSEDEHGETEKLVNAAFTKSYGVTVAELIAELTNLIEGSSDPESGSLWF